MIRRQVWNLVFVSCMAVVALLVQYRGKSSLPSEARRYMREMESNTQSDKEGYDRRLRLLQNYVKLNGIQTRQMRTKMFESCPRELWLQTSISMKMPDFVQKVFDGLEQVQVPEDPQDYISKRYGHFMEDRGALGNGFWSEFGVFGGKTLQKAHRHLQRTNFTGNMAGFDSFEGLPVKWRGGFTAGFFSTNYTKVRNKLPKEIALYKGWFQDTIGDFLRDNPRVPASLISFDADLYVSTSIVFDLLGQRIVPGTLLCFDELIGYPGYLDHEMLALFVWMKRVHSTLCPVAVKAPLDRNPSREVRPPRQGACFQVLDLAVEKSSLSDLVMSR